MKPQKFTVGEVVTFTHMGELRIARITEVTTRYIDNIAQYYYMVGDTLPDLLPEEHLFKHEVLTKYLNMKTTMKVEEKKQIEKQTKKLLEEKKGLGKQMQQQVQKLLEEVRGEVEKGYHVVEEAKKELKSGDDWIKVGAKIISKKKVKFLIDESGEDSETAKERIVGTITKLGSDNTVYIEAERKEHEAIVGFLRTHIEPYYLQIGDIVDGKIPYYGPSFIRFKGLKVVRIISNTGQLHGNLLYVLDQMGDLWVEREYLYFVSRDDSLPEKSEGEAM